MESTIIAMTVGFIFLFLFFLFSPFFLFFISYPFFFPKFNFPILFFSSSLFFLLLLIIFLVLSVTDEGLLTTTYYRDSNASDSLPATTAVCFSIPPPGYQKTQPMNSNLQKSLNKNNSNGTTIIGVAVGVSLAVILLILLILLVIIIIIIVSILIARKRKREKQSNNSSSSGIGNETELSDFSRANINIDSSKFVIKYSDLKKEERLAKGSFGTVFKGKYKGSIVAIKEFILNFELQDQESQKIFIKELENEITMLSQLRHRNILNFTGACIQPPVYAIVTEFIEGGSLSSLLHSSDTLDLRKLMKWEHKLDLIYGVSQACLYLHEKALL